MIDRTVFWIVAAGLGIGTYLIRFSFLGLLGARPLPPALTRALRYTAVAVLPALVAPVVLWPPATHGHPDPARLIAACVTIAAGVLSRNTLVAILGGAVALYLSLATVG